MGSSELQIEVEEGGASVRILVLDGGPYIFGREPGLDLTLTGDETVSKRHAQISRKDGSLELTNLSPNGTMVNGRPVVSTALAVGDKISIGRRHILRISLRPAPVRSEPDPTDAEGTIVGWQPTPPAASRRVAAPPAKTGKKSKLPTWLVAYLGLMVVGSIALGVWKLRQGNESGLTVVLVSERAYATESQLPADETERILRLLEVGMIRERRGDGRSAYEAYREVLGARKPLAPQSPAYRFAAGRMAALGSK